MLQHLLKHQLKKQRLLQSSPYSLSILKLWGILLTVPQPAQVAELVYAYA